MTAATISARRRRGTFLRRRRAVGFALTLPALVFVGLFFFWPLLRMAWMSLHDWPLVGIVRFVGANNYVGLFTDERFMGALAVSLVFVVVATPLTVLFGLGLALLVRRNRPGAAVFRSIYFLPLVIGFAPASYIWLWLLNPDVGIVNRILLDFGIVDTPIRWLAEPSSAVVAVVTLFVWKTVGFSMLLLMGGLQSVPQDVREAASVDGAGRFRTFASVTLPMIRRTVGLVFVFSTVGSFLIFEPFFILTRGGPGATTTGVVQWLYSTSFFNYDLGYGAAGSIVVLLLLIVFTAVQLRTMREDPE